MRTRWRAAALAIAGLMAAACGTNATGITLAIDPDPVEATRQANGTYAAGWDAVVADLTGVGGTVESIDAAVMGATEVTTGGRVNPGGSRLAAPNMAVAPFARKLFHQSAQFTAASAQPVSVQVTVTFRDESGQTYQSTAEARVNLR